METIISKDNHLKWNVISSELKQCGKQQREYFRVECPECGWQQINLKINIQRKKKCPGCGNKPAALKTDKAGTCISICEIGSVEFVRDYQEQYGVSEREAVRQFVDTVKAKLIPDDPVNDSLTEESVRAVVRRTTGRKKDELKNWGESPQNSKAKIKSYRVKAEVEAVKEFLDNHLPGYMLLNVKTNLKNGSVFSIEPSVK